MVLHLTLTFQTFNGFGLVTILTHTASLKSLAAILLLASTARYVLYVW